MRTGLGEHCDDCGADDWYYYPEDSKRMCAPCNIESSNKWMKDNPQWRRKRTLRRHHDMSLKEYESLLDKQGGVCAICSEEPAEGNNLHVDHDHDTGQIRGLLCPNCNKGLGQLGDNVEGVRKALKYLQSGP